VHALAHVLYETGQHEHGRVWLDHWVAQSGRSASHRAHFSWHAALHELALGDTEAVRRRYYSQLAPPAVTGVRALVDSTSLVWRWRVTLAGWDAAVSSGLGGSSQAAFPGESATPPVAEVLAGVDPALLDHPQTPFVALHAAVALAAAGDAERVRRLARHCRGQGDSALARTVARACDAFEAALEQRWAAAVQIFDDVLPGLAGVGGSLAQREIVEETMLLCLVHAGRAGAVERLLEARLDRRPSPLDQRRLRSVSAAAAEPSLAAR
jgi:hypothetical protein